MAEEKDQNTRQLKIKGMTDGEGDEKGKKKEKKEKENKLWVFILLVVTILISVLFSARAENGWLSQIGRKKESTKMISPETKREVSPKKQGPTWWGSAVYEFEK